MAEDLGERTEEPTGKRLGEARSKGQVAKSADLSAAVLLSGAAVLLLMFAPHMFHAAVELVRTGLSGDVLSGDLTTGSLVPVSARLMAGGAMMVAPIMAVLVLVSFAGALYQVGWQITPAALEPKFGKLNFFKNFKNLLNKKAMVKGGIDLSKFALIGTVAGVLIAGDWDQIIAMANLTPTAAIALSGEMIRELAIWIIVVLIVLAVIDFTYQRWQHRRDLRMTKQEVKEERKDNEGDIEMKGRRIRMARQIAMQRIGSAVPKADVVVTNPTHYAVALKYEQNDRGHAPVVVAKGADYLALKMRYLAAAHGVPIVERPPLARSLYNNVPVGKEIYPEHYEAVAEVLSYVYRLNQEALAAV